MTTDLVIAHPATGEIIDLHAPDFELGRFLDEVRDLESRLREAKAEVSRVLHERMDASLSWTIDCGEFKLTGRSNEPVTTYDVQRLVEILDNLVAEGTITPAAASLVVTPVTEYKVRAAGVKALRKNPEIAALLDECATTEPPKDRRISVKRA